jgi:predicted deacetylase
MNSTKYLLRFDDLCPTMDWRMWSEIEAILKQHRLKPVLAVVPDNRDAKLQVQAPVADFWDRVRAWQEWGWTIALHGFQHRYVSWHAGIVALRKKSEFAGLPRWVQREKLHQAMQILERERVTPRVWIAPGNTFDLATVSLLPEFGLRIICDGHFRFPFVYERQMTWVPQQLFQFRPAPPGVWTVGYHHNDWKASDLDTFRRNVADYGAQIASLENVLETFAPRPRRSSQWLCLHPRCSRLLIRLELKLWPWRAAGRTRPHVSGINPIQLSR